MAIDLILGTAGHIDHGKTALVRALTGVDTDRLPEEKKRGITIELGFAQLQMGDFRLGVVDVPGHERFVRQMLAGATGMDLVMLVVAADDSVKPQTREHMEVLRMLDVRAGVIVLTKCDLADNEWVELVEAEVRELVEGSFLQSAPIVRTSVVTGQGIEELKLALIQAAEDAASRIDPSIMAAPFRMAIDRAFTIDGHGTVVTGSVVSGNVSVGDELAIQPDDIRVRVRSLQNHDQSVAAVQRGQRAAINLAGVHPQTIHRGHELAKPGHLRPSHLVTAHLTLLPASSRPLKHRDHIRVHVGTAEVLATVALLDRAKLPPGESAALQLYLREPIASVWRQPLVIRRESPLETIGGGFILVPEAEKLRSITEIDRLRLTQLRSESPRDRAAAALYFHGLQPWNSDDLMRLAGIAKGDDVVKQLLDAELVVPLVVSPTRTVMLEAQLLQGWYDRFSRALTIMHAREPLRASFEKSQLLRKFEYVNDRPLLETMLTSMKMAGLVCLGAGGVSLAEHETKLTVKQRAMLDEIANRFRAGRFQPPAVADCYDLHPKQPKEVEKLIQLAASSGLLVEFAKEMYLHADVELEMRTILSESLATPPGMTLSEIRERLHSTRKYAVPICEYLDRIGFTKRVGDLRVLGQTA